MKIDTTEQIENILFNLSNLENMYLEYTRRFQDFTKIKTYLDYLKGNLINSRGLASFYITELRELPAVSKIEELAELQDVMTLSEDLDYSIFKAYNFPDPPMHKCNYFTGYFQMQGEGLVKLEKTEVHLKEGDFVIIPPHNAYSIESFQNGIGIYFDFRYSFIVEKYQQLFLGHPQLISFICAVLQNHDGSLYLVLHTAGNKELRELIFSIFRERINKPKYCRECMYNYLQVFFANLIRDPNLTIDSSVRENPLERQYQDLVEYLNANYAQATLTSASEHVNYSKQYICKIVRKKTGKTFNTLLSELRIEKAKGYLLDSGLSHEIIAELCGFSSASQLSKSFKKYCGISPSEFRNRN